MKTLLMTAAAAVALVAAAPAMAETIAITNAHIFTSGPQGEIASGTIVIKDGTIASVSKGSATPAGARVIDAKGAVVTAGLIASDSELGAVEVGALGNDVTVKNADLGAGFDIQYGLNPASTVIPVARMGGITAAIVTPEPAGGGFGDSDEARDYTAGAGDGEHSVSGLFAGQAAVVQLAAGSKDMLVKPRVAMVTPLGGAGAKVAGGARGAEFVQLKEAIANVRWYMKNKSAFEHGQTQDLHLSRADLEALIPVVEGRMPLLVSVDRVSDIRQALKLARDEHIRIILDGAAEGWEMADEIAAAKVSVIVYPLADLPNDFENIGARLDNAGRLSAAGVPVIIKAAEGGAHRVRETRYDAGNAVAHGMSWQAALDSITINPARAFGVDKEMGSLEPGKSADLVVWSGDPFEPLTQPVAIYIHGQLQPMGSRQIDLSKRYMDLSPGYPPQFKP